MQEPDAENRLAWVIVAAELGGTRKETIIAPPPAAHHYFPDAGGMSNIYVDVGAVVCPFGSVVVGVFFWKKDVLTGKESELRNTNSHEYFPSTGGCSDVYADTNMVARPEDLLRMAGRGCIVSEGREQVGDQGSLQALMGNLQVVLSPLTMYVACDGQLLVPANLLVRSVHRSSSRWMGSC
ncbi:hypothetical protein BV25DRAFT_816334 [Artomyces pyxidatus]|uniref:Uncharacterized protein n=1 Tax=Artomyces pyxidatus TaxID=48021 RepID=A0ACB8SXJ2_9AGAM|nr:hypothetical protein BV25DRAFT_816334 [Artomyces pyxidatus]